MVLGGFSCSKNALAALNVLYILVSFVLIGVAAYGRVVAIVTSLTLVGSIIACGVGLLLIAIIGLIGAIKHHQVILFFYMIILFLLFLVQFALACACLAVNTEQQQAIVRQGWRYSSHKTRNEVQIAFDCCGLDDTDLAINATNGLGHPPCMKTACCKDSSHPCCAGAGNTTDTSGHACPCKTCWLKIQPKIDKSFKITGGVGLFFSFTEIIGVWLAVRFRNQKDPRANPGAFL